MRWLSDRNVERLLSITEGPDFSSTKYRIVKEIARGGMGTVYLAADAELDRKIAIKVLNAPEANSDLVRRMMREARIIARLEHPGIVPVHDVGMLADGSVFYAMKLVRGQRLDEYAAQTESIKDRLRKFQAACEALAFAHAHGVIHRDLKPQNIMIGAFGEVLVLDWGAAKLQHQNRSRESSPEADTLMLPPHKPALADIDAGTVEETAHGTVIGTRGYMAPEQARGEIEQLDARADVYALGAILYFLLTSRSPSATDGESLPQGMVALPRPRELNAKINKRAEAVCLKAMSPACADRYATARELAAEIAKLIDDEPVTAYRENVIERISRWTGKNRFLVFLVLAYLLMRIFFILTARR